MKKVLRFIFCLSVTIILCMLICFSAAVATDVDSVELRVEKGDKLIKLCNKYLENPKRWHEVARFNRMKNPDMILPGQRVKFPVQLMAGVPVDGKVTFVYGDVKVQKNEKTDWVSLSLGNTVTRGSSIQTGKSSSVELTFEDKNSIFIKSVLLHQKRKVQPIQ
jgi:hypothetical protein